ncbi:NAD(P)/FAD-dependent oxidoreductase [Candidatus Micrarchaeota archaeon]|nr:NAD(P)/FAD-dependent oxidoreductase [Candidatus Micrarchaeota archaeon]
MSDVHIVGAGPAGSLSAISALEKGHEVVISEDHPESGYPKNCSGLFSKDGLSSLSIDYKKHIINPIYGANIYFVDQKLEIRKKQPVGFVCNRSKIDRSLAETAERLGAKINYNEKIKDSFHSKTIIGADGPLSAVARHFSFPKISAYAFTLQSFVDYQAEDPYIVEVFLSSRFKGFFGWIIPHNEDVAEFGVGSLNNVQGAWKALLDIKRISAPTPRGWTIPIAVRPRTSLAKNNYKVLLVGDAAGQVKSTTGGGVIFGGHCAKIAGRTLSPLLYELEWRTQFGIDLKIHQVIQNYLAGQSDAGIQALGRRLKKLNCDEFLSGFGHMDRPTKMLGPEMVAHVIRNLGV